MESEKELHMVRQNQQLKKRIQEMEQFCGDIDDEYQKSLKELMAEKQDLKAKHTALGNRVFTLAEENEELKKLVETLEKRLSEKNTPPEPPTTQSNPMSESFVAEYHALQDKVDELNENKAKLQARIGELESHLKEMIQRIESLESENAELAVALSSVSTEKKNLAAENKRMAESVTIMQMQIDTMEMTAPTIADRREPAANSLFGEIAAEREQMLKDKANNEKEIAVLRKTLGSINEEKRQSSKDVECLRESLKTLSERNKQLQHELERRMDAEAESVAVKQAAAMVERENECLKKENARLRKKFVNAESRADENAHLLSKSTVSRSEFYKGIQQQQADLTYVHSTPRPILRERTPSLTRNESVERRAIERKPSSLRSLSTTPAPRMVSSLPKDPPPIRKRGIMLDYTEAPDRKRLDFKVQKLSDNHQLRQLDHLKSHYDSDTGTYDQAHGESPESAAKKGTPRKENRILNKILRR